MDSIAPGKGKAGLVPSQLVKVPFIPQLAQLNTIINPLRPSADPFNDKEFIVDQILPYAEHPELDKVINKPEPFTLP